MPHFYILRIQREDTFQNEIQIKFFPFYTAQRGVPVRVFAETEDAAFFLATQRFPYLRSSLAIQECKSYDATIAAVIARRFLGRASGANPGATAEGPIRSRVPVGDSAIPERGKRRPDENPVEAQQVG